MDEIPFCPVKPVRGGRPLDGLFKELMSDPSWMTQAKLHGKRAVWDGDGTLWSRTGNVITRCSRVLSALAGLDQALDAEFVPVKGEQRAVLWVFDLPDHRGDLDERWATLREIVNGLASPGVIEIVPAGVRWGDVERQGWEGLVFKRRTSRYPKAFTQGKTTGNWVKYRAEWL